MHQCCLRVIQNADALKRRSKLIRQMRKTKEKTTCSLAQRPPGYNANSIWFRGMCNTHRKLKSSLITASEKAMPKLMSLGTLFQWLKLKRNSSRLFSHLQRNSDAASLLILTSDFKLKKFSILSFFLTLFLLKCSTNL